MNFRFRAVLLGWSLCATAAAAAPVIDPAELAYHEQPGNSVPVTLPFRDEGDHPVTLADIAHGRPLLLVPAYYGCSSLCGLVRSSLYGALGPVGAGGYAVAVLSIDPAEHGDDARLAQAHDRLALSAVPGLKPHYLTGTATNIQAVTAAVGFHDRRDAASGQFLHPAGVVVLTGGGIVSGYLLGVSYTPDQVRAALARAQAGRLAAIGAPLLLLCFHYDVASGRYSLEVMKVLRLAAFMTVLVVMGVVGLMFRREHS